MRTDNDYDKLENISKRKNKIYFIENVKKQHSIPFIIFWKNKLNYFENFKKYIREILREEALEISIEREGNL